MEIREIGELGFMARIRKRFAVNTQKVRLGMGHEASILFLTPGNEVVPTVDLIIEGIDFILSLITRKVLGRKSLAVDLNEFTARGATPQYGLRSLAIPARPGVGIPDECSARLSEFADPFGISMVGREPSASPGQFFMNFTLLGLGEKKRSLLAKGPSPEPISTSAVYRIGSFRKSGRSRGREAVVRFPAIPRSTRLRFQRMADRIVC